MNRLLDAPLMLLIVAGIGAVCPGQQFVPAAALPGDDTPAPSAGNQRQPAIAYGNGAALAVWQDDRSSLVDSVFGGQAAGSSQPGNFDIYGVLLDAAGQPSTPAPLVVNGDTWDQKNARVAWNGSQYLVVFESTQPTAFYYSQGIYAARVSASGVLLDPVPIRVDDDPGQDEMRPVVASLGGRWLVTWQDVDAVGNGVARSAFVDANGIVGSKQTLASGAFLAAPTDLALTASGSQYVLAYSVASPFGVWAARFDINAVGLGAPFVVAGSPARRPSIATDGTAFYVAWLEGLDVRGTPVSATGSITVPGGTTLMPADSNSRCAVAFDGQQWTVATDASPSMLAVQVAPGGVPGNPLVVSTSSRYVDDVAIGGGAGGVTVLWTDGRTTPNNYGVDPDDVFGATLSAGGIVGSSTAISVSPPAQIQAGLAGSPETGFLLVYASLTGGATRIMGHALDGQGSSLGAPFLIESGDRSIDRPDVAWNGSEYLVAWQHRLSLPVNGPPTQIEARRCLSDGTLLDPTPLVIMEGVTPSLAAVDGTFLLVAPFHHPILQSNVVVRYRRIDGQSGLPLDPAPTSITFAAGGPTAVVGMSNRWLLLWGNGSGAYVLANGALQAPFYAFDTGASSTRFQLAVNAEGDEAVVAYQYRSSLTYRSDIRMRRFDLSGGSPDPLLGPIVADQNQAQLRPTIVALDQEYMCMWADHRDVLDYEPGLGDVYAARLGAQGNLLDPAGIAVFDGPLAEGGVTAIRTARGSALYVASNVQEGIFGTHRLVVSNYRNPSTTPWSEVGSGLAGSLGEPTIEGYGTLLAQTSFDVTLGSVTPSSIGVLALGLSQAGLPLFGGVLVPTPDVTLTVFVGPNGSWTFSSTWPSGFSGTSIYAQFWVLDATAPQAFAASAGLRGIAP